VVILLTLERLSGLGALDLWTSGPWPPKGWGLPTLEGLLLT
jgi:hypothetical protein